MSTPIARPPAAVMRELLLECLKSGLEFSTDISKRINLPVEMISCRLHHMRAKGLVTSTPCADNVRGGRLNRWRLSAKPTADEIANDDYPRPRRKENDVRIVVQRTTYPAIGMRDPLVAALFGAPAAAPERNHP